MPEILSFPFSVRCRSYFSKSRRPVEVIKFTKWKPTNVPSEGCWAPMKNYVSSKHPRKNLYLRTALSTRRVEVSQGGECPGPFPDPMDIFWRIWNVSKTMRSVSRTRKLSNSKLSHRFNLLKPDEEKKGGNLKISNLQNSISLFHYDLSMVFTFPVSFLFGFFVSQTWQPKSSLFPFLLALVQCTLSPPLPSSNRLLFTSENTRHKKKRFLLRKRVMGPEYLNKTSIQRIINVYFIRVRQNPFHKGFLTQRRPGKKSILWKNLRK